MELMPRLHTGTRCDPLPKGSRVDHTAGEYTTLPDYYFSYAVAQLKKKKNNFVQDREIGISTGLSRDSLIE